jgi:hypothetical protein
MDDLRDKINNIENDLADLNSYRPAFMIELGKIRALLFVVAVMMVSVAMSFIWHIIVQS